MLNYLGSKRSLLSFLEEHIREFCSLRPGMVFCDLFAGTGTVGRHFRQLGCHVIANDIQYYSYCLNRVYIGLSAHPQFSGLVGRLPPPAGHLWTDPVDQVLDHLNRLEGIPGFVYHHYCPGGTAATSFPRQYFTDTNGQRCDAIRSCIRDWQHSGHITEDEYYYLLASLVEAMDRVANTASVYAAFLKHIKKTACQPLCLLPPAVTPGFPPGLVSHADGALFIEQIDCDILYLDPPYNQRQYCTNYHLLETIARYDNPELHGATGLRPHMGQKSDFCSVSRAPLLLDHILRQTRAPHVFLSYNSEGIMSESRIVSIMEKHGRLQIRKKPHRRFRADTDGQHRRYRSDEVIEYLFCLQRKLPPGRTTP